MARDLRLVTATLKLISDIERIGDEVKKIAKQIVSLPTDMNYVPIVQETAKCGKKIKAMLRDALSALARSEDIHQSLHNRDLDVNEECRQIIESVLVKISDESGDVNQLQKTLSLIWVLRSLERIGDHTKNIGEYTAYLIEGKDIRHPEAQ